MSEHKENVPKLRFPEFSGAWEERRLGDVTTKIGSGKTPKGGNSSYVSTGVPLIRSQNIYDNCIHSDNVVYISSETDEDMKNSRVKKNDVLLNITGASIGRSAVYKHSDPANVNQHVCIIRPDDGVEADFIQLNLSSSKGQKEIELNQAGGGREGLNFQQISKISFFYPPKNEQRVISRFFKQFDQLITFHQHKLINVKSLKAGLLQKMFPKNGEDFPEVRFPGFTDAWEQREYGEVIDLLSGQDFSPSEYNDRCNGIPYMTGASCIVGRETIVNRWTTVARCIAEKGDVLLVCKGSGYGAIAVLAQDKAHIARQFMALKNLPNLDKVFNLYLLNSVIENIKKDARGLIAGIARDAVLKQEISIPLLEEQSQIGKFFSNLDNLITLHQRKLEHLQEQKKVLLIQMFV
ncbi:restriction endonuclease subunit S [Paenibacillus sp. FSL R5-0701]|uniref:restriction endonuclease subunit S n=1 Tax=Paenibacillus sp. FSL R5-0701 TaxID=2921654 RepID=UPI0030CDFEFB